VALKIIEEKKGIKGTEGINKIELLWWAMIFGALAVFILLLFLVIVKNRGG